ncbi:DNA repair protein RecO [Hanstruepera neustonica]|uniref:DNA repair protein RecO n=1 Tax=Hanstruepera neustonica TaxID=1445657 RepID=A0A2K1E3T0_9FLAO|nr:DNA repair protein RecO [Hanstruepera neustonica]PNQ74927.1 DNA repair protein RecO [Hanstruepera neustonica]
MLGTNKAIVLSKIKYRENDIIVKCYTLKRGVVSYLIRNAFKSKNHKTIAYYQPLSQLFIDEKYKQNQSLHYITEVKSSFVYKTLHTNVLKSSVTIFIAEILATVLKEEEQNNTLFEYIELSLQWLDTETDFSNFHLLFLLELTKYLGFYPESKYDDKSIFNLQSGAFEISLIDKYSISEQNNTVLKRLLGMKFDELNQLQLNVFQRRNFLNMLLLYYELHLGYFKKPKSLEVFSQLFN